MSNMPLKGRRCIGFRNMNAFLQEQAVLRWAAEQSLSAVVTVQRLSRTELKSHFEKTGEMPDHSVRVDPGGEKFFIR